MLRPCWCGDAPHQAGSCQAWGAGPARREIRAVCEMDLVGGAGLALGDCADPAAPSWQLHGRPQRDHRRRRVVAHRGLRAGVVTARSRQKMALKESGGKTTLTSPSRTFERSARTRLEVPMAEGWRPVTKSSLSCCLTQSGREVRPRRDRGQGHHDAEWSGRGRHGPARERGRASPYRRDFADVSPVDDRDPKRAG